MRKNSTPILLPKASIAVSRARMLNEEALKRLKSVVPVTCRNATVAYFVPLEVLDNTAAHPGETVRRRMSDIRDCLADAIEETPIILITFNDKPAIYLFREDKYRQLFLRR
jgi:hypothetical protein